MLAFDSDDRYWGEVDREHMQRVNAAARAIGWHAALERELRPTHPHLVDYVHHPARADWRVLLPLDRQRSVVLDVGAGWGANSFALAPQVRRVYAMEKIAERVEFIAIRAHQDAVTNLVPVRADLHALPFRNQSLDVIVVNGVLEWAGLVDPAAASGGRPRGPRRLQEAFLRALALRLRPGGTLYVGIENRWGLNFWRGMPDHQGLRFTSLMPRPLARAYTRLRQATSDRTYRGERDYRTYTYSLAGYKTLLRSCGFSDIEAYAAIGGYNVPALLVPLESRGPFRFLAGRHAPGRSVPARIRRLTRFALASTGLARELASSYVFAARRG